MSLLEFVGIILMRSDAGYVMSEQLEFLYGHRCFSRQSDQISYNLLDASKLLQSYGVEPPAIDGRNYSTSWIGRTQ